MSTRQFVFRVLLMCLIPVVLIYILKYVFHW